MLLYVRIKSKRKNKNATQSAKTNQMLTTLLIPHACTTVLLLADAMIPMFALTALLIPPCLHLPALTAAADTRAADTRMLTITALLIADTQRATGLTDFGFENFQ
jgi:hypothetical protein